MELSMLSSHRVFQLNLWKRIINKQLLSKKTNITFLQFLTNFFYRMVTSSFYQKAELERYIIDYISEADYVELIDAMYEPMLDSNLSFIAKTESGKIVGVAINFDAWNEPEIEIKSKLSVIWEFLDYVEIPVK